MYKNAVTDRSVIPYPDDPPDPGVAGSVIVDPFCGNRILRVTDPHTDNGKPGQSYTAPSSSEAQPWSCDSRAFVVLDEGGWTWLYQFSGLEARLVKRLSGSVSSYQFSGQQPGLLWGVSDMEIVQYSAYGDEVMPIVDLRQYPELGIPESERWYVLSLSVAHTDQRLCAYLGPAQDQADVVVVWDEFWGLAWLKTSTGEYGGWNGGGAIGGWNPFLVHNTRISQGGACVRIRPGGRNAMAFWQPGMGLCQYQEQSEATPVGGHQAMGYAHYYGSSQRSVPFQWLVAPLFALHDWQDLMVPVPDPVAGFWDDFHMSVQPDSADRNPLLISTYNEANPAAPGAPLTSAAAADNEILALAADGSGRWWRLAHHYATGSPGAFYSTPRGNVSPCGKHFLFTSDWCATLGGEKPMQRTDVFVLDTTRDGS